VELTARRWLTDEAPRATVVLAHGFTASADDPKLVAVAEALHSDGLDVVTYDARGHGSSGGACTLGDLERHDVAAAVELARSRSERVVLVGASMGAIAVLRHAADDPTVTGTVVVSAPSRWVLPRNARSMAAALLTRTPPGRAVAARYLRVTVAPRWTNPESPIELVSRINGPLAIIHGESDKFIPPDAARELHERAGGPCRVETVEGMGHAFEQRSIAPVVHAVDWTLQAADAALRSA
jgi:alpha-beta hydrolase superfamily lysophospholipase